MRKSKARQNMTPISVQLAQSPRPALLQIMPIMCNTRANVKLKKLAFYEIVAEFLEPFILVGQEKYPTTNYLPGTREVTFKLKLSSDHTNFISLNCDTSKIKHEYLYQVQIRICLLEPGSAKDTEITDYLPMELNIQINDKKFPLPLPPITNTRLGSETKRTGQPIDCTEFLKLNPNIANTFSVNWTPDGKTYVMGVYLVKKLTSEDLLQKLKDKKPISSEETKNYIIKKLTDVDPDLATTSFRFSLVCPLGMIRMKVPARSINCKHLQCFDARIFILMNEKKPTWLCPTCGSSCLYDEIQIQSYFLEIVSSPNLPDNCIEIELLTDGTWRVCEKNNKTVQTAAGIKEEPIHFINLDDSNDGNFMELKIDPNPVENLLNDSENLKLTFVDLTLSDDEESIKDLIKQENEAQTTDAVMPIITVNLKPQAQVQPQQAVTSSEEEVIIEID